MGLQQIKQPYEILEHRYADFVGSRYAVSCNSGTSALHLALLAVGVRPGDEVIVPDFTMAACGFAVSYCGAKPVFGDVNLDDYGLQVSEVEKLITKKTKAIMVVHVYGRLAKDMDQIIKIARKHKIPVIEDACEAQGAIYDSAADVTCYSFYRNKIIHAEEGGMVTTNSVRIAARVGYLKNMAFDKGHTYFHADIGFNYRMPNSQAQMALLSLENFYSNRIDRRYIELWYDEELGGGRSKRDAVWFYETLVPSKLIPKILKKNADARGAFKPLSSFPMYKQDHETPNASWLSKSLILLPVQPGMGHKRIKDICDSLKELGMKNHILSL